MVTAGELIRKSRNNNWSRAKLRQEAGASSRLPEVFKPHPNRKEAQKYWENNYKDIAKSHGKTIVDKKASCILSNRGESKGDKIIIKKRADLALMNAIDKARGKSSKSVELHELGHSIKNKKLRLEMNKRGVAKYPSSFETRNYYGKDKIAEERAADQYVYYMKNPRKYAKRFPYEARMIRKDLRIANNILYGEN